MWVLRFFLVGQAGALDFFFNDEAMPRYYMMEYYRMLHNLKSNNNDIRPLAINDDIGVNCCFMPTPYSGAMLYWQPRLIEEHTRINKANNALTEKLDDDPPAGFTGNDPSRRKV